jgi:hypothetical protein
VARAYPQRAAAAVGGGIANGCGDHPLRPPWCSSATVSTKVGDAICICQVTDDGCRSNADWQAALRIRAWYAAVVIFWRNFSVSDRTAAQLSVTFPTAANSGHPVISRMPDATMTTEARMVARPNGASALIRQRHDEPRPDRGNLTQIFCIQAKLLKQPFRELVIVLIPWHFRSIARWSRSPRLKSISESTRRLRVTGRGAGASVVAGGKLFDQIDDAAAELWIIDRHE